MPRSGRRNRKICLCWKAFMLTSPPKDIKKNPSMISARPSESAGRGGQGEGEGEGEADGGAKVPPLLLRPEQRLFLTGHWVAGFLGPPCPAARVRNKSTLTAGEIFLFCPRLFVPGVPLPALYLHCLCFLFTAICVMLSVPMWWILWSLRTGLF